MRTYKITKNGLSFSLQDGDSCIGMESCFDFLKREIEKIDRYSDRSLFFQNYKIIDKWLELVDVIAERLLSFASSSTILRFSRISFRNSAAFIGS